MRAFEIQTFQGGKWQIDSIFDDRDLAMIEAQRMDESGRYLGVRVTEEIFDEATDHTIARTIFRGSKVDQENSAALERSKATRGEALTERRRRRIRAQKRGTAARAKRGGKLSPVGLVLLFALLTLAALGALIGLQYLEAYL